jgi:hypothetical protein
MLERAEGICQLGRGLPAPIPCVQLVTPLLPARQGLTIEKLYIFYTNSNEDDFYIKIIAPDEIYNFIVWSFFI